MSNEFEMILIKTGTISPGILDASKLPEISLYMNFDSSRLLYFKMKLSGSLQIVASTCKIPPVLVPMGSHQSKTFTKIGSATGWQAFNITLNDCPAFHGIYGKEGSSAPSWLVGQSGTNPSGFGFNGRATSNQLQFRIDSAYPAINGKTGVLRLDPGSANSVPPATGIGVQVADRLGNALPLATYRDSGLSLNATQSSYNIPLRARYLQTSNTVTPGPANASATFTLLYQ